MIRVYIAYTGRAVSTSTFFQGFTYYVSYGFRISLHGYVVSKSVFLRCIAQLYLKIVSCILVTGRRKLLLQTFIGRHFFFTPLISYCLKSQHSTYCSGKKALLGVAKSLEVTQLRVPRRGRHFGKLDDVIIHIQFWFVCERVVISYTSCSVRSLACKKTFSFLFEN